MRACRLSPALLHCPPERGEGLVVVPSLLAMLAHGPRPLHRLLQVRKLFLLFCKTLVPQDQR